MDYLRNKVEIEVHMLAFQTEALKAGVVAVQQSLLLLEDPNLETEQRVRLLAALLQAAALVVRSSDDGSCQ